MSAPSLLFNSSPSNELNEPFVSLFCSRQHDWSLTRLVINTTDQKWAFFHIWPPIPILMLITSSLVTLHWIMDLHSYAKSSTRLGPKWLFAPRLTRSLLYSLYILPMSAESKTSACRCVNSLTRVRTELNHALFLSFDMLALLPILCSSCLAI